MAAEDVTEKEKGRPRRTIQINETISNAPLEELDVEEVLSKKRGGRPSKQQNVQEEPEPGTAIIEDPDEDKFHSYLQDGTVKIHVDRVSPREWKGTPISGMIEEYVTPTTMDEIESDIRNRYGGGRYRIRIMRHGRFIMARGMNVTGNPKIEETEDDGDEMDFERPPMPMPPFGVPPGPPMQTDEIMQLRQNIEKEKLRNHLEEVKESRDKSRGGNVDPDRIARETEERVRKEMETRSEIQNVKVEMNQKLSEFTDKIASLLRAQKETDPGRQSDIVALDNKIERIKTDVTAEVKSNFAEIRSLLQGAAKPDNSAAMMQAMIQGFSQMANSGEAKLTAIMQAEAAKANVQMEAMKSINEANARVAQAQTDKLVAVMQTQTKGGGNGISGVAETIAAVREIAETMGMSNGGAAAVDDEAEPQSLTERLAGMVEKALPTVLAAIKQKSDQAAATGRPMTQEEIAAIYRQEAAKQTKAAAQQAAQQIVNENRARLTQNPPQLLAPTQQPPMQVQVPPQPQQHGPGIPMGPRPVNTERPQIVQGPIVMPPQPQIQPRQPQQVVEEVQAEVEENVVVEPPAQAQEPAKDPVHAQKADIVNECMETLMTEIKIRPRAPEWPEQAFDTLPEDVLNQLVVAMSIEEVVKAIAPYADPKYLDELKNVLVSEKRAQEWLVKSLNALKDLYTEENSEEVQAETE